MISKKGQLTIFIIVGILIVTAIATVFFVVQKGTEDKVGEVDSETGKNDVRIGSVPTIYRHFPNGQRRHSQALSLPTRKYLGGL